MACIIVVEIVEPSPLHLPGSLRFPLDSTVRHVPQHRSYQEHALPSLRHTRCQGRNSALLEWRAVVPIGSHSHACETAMGRGRRTQQPGGAAERERRLLPTHRGVPDRLGSCVQQHAVQTRPPGLLAEVIGFHVWQQQAAVSINSTSCVCYCLALAACTSRTV